MTIELINQDLERRVGVAVGRLMVLQSVPGGRVLLNVPVTYPSGSSTVVEIERNGDKIWVSDMGMGLVEAEMMSAQDSYQQLAHGKADEFGVSYDGSAMFVLWAPIDRIEAAIVCVANASARAAIDAVRHASEVQHKRQEDIVFQRVKLAFGEARVARTAEISGKRTAWPAHNVVILSSARRAIFEPMSKHPNSVSSKFLMFSDIRDNDQKISLNVVVENIKMLDAKAMMVGDVANIVEIGASDDTFRRYGRVA